MLSPKMEYLSTFSPSKAQESLSKTVGTDSKNQSSKETALQTQQSTNGLTTSMTTCTRSVQTQARSNLKMEREGEHEIPPLAKDLLTTDHY